MARAICYKSINSKNNNREAFGLRPVSWERGGGVGLVAGISAVKLVLKVFIIQKKTFHSVCLPLYL